MIPTNILERRKVIEYMLQMLENIDESEKSLTQWEEEFIDSIRSQYATKKDLSDRQCEILERIYDKGR